jgi:predicted nucleic acid-binding protein
MCRILGAWGSDSVQLVIADTGPVNYLILIGHIDVLPAIFEKVVLPAAVRDELKHCKASAIVQQWIADPPSWVEIHEIAHVHDPSMDALDPGEEDAIALAVELHADLILMDDRDGVLIARSKGFRVAGTLGVLSMAAERGLVNLAQAFERIKRTSFHYRQDIMDQLLADAANLR